MNEEIQRLKKLAGITEYIHDFSDRKREVLGPYFMTQDKIDKYEIFSQDDLNRPYLVINGRYSFYKTPQEALQAKLALQNIIRSK